MKNADIKSLLLGALFFPAVLLGVAVLNIPANGSGFVKSSIDGGFCPPCAECEECPPCPACP